MPPRAPRSSDTPRKPRAAKPAEPKVRVEPAALDKPARFAAAERELIAEALRRGEELRDEVETKVIAYGRWLLGAIFHDDARAALEDKRKNVVWRELERRAGGPTLPVNRKLLYVALNVAARDKRIGDQAWRRLDLARKELLLPLADDAALREGAQHVTRFNLTLDDTQAYVTAQLAELGTGRQVRLTAPRLVARVRRLREGFGDATLLRKVGDLYKELPKAEREEVVDEIERLQTSLGELVRAMRGKR